MSYVIDKRAQRDYPNYPVTWVDMDVIQSNLYLKSDENRKICKSCLGWSPPTQCADCTRLSPWWYDGLPFVYN